MNGRILQQSGPLQKKTKFKTNCHPNSYDSASVELEKEILGTKRV